MSRSKIVPVALAAVIAVGSVGAARAETRGREGRQEIGAVLQARTTAAQAIAAAEHQSGGRALRIGIARDGTSPVYAVRTLTGDTLATILVNPSTGEVIRSEPRPTGRRDSDDQRELAMFRAAPTTLAAAIAAAEQNAGGGRAVEARFENENGTTMIEVEVIKDNATHRLKVDAASGQVSAAAADDEEQDED